MKIGQQDMQVFTMSPFGTKNDIDFDVLRSR